MTQHSTFTSNQLGRDPPFPPRAWTTIIPPRTWVTVIPQRPYARRGDREQQESIIFKVNGRSGILAKRAIGKTYAGLEGRDDQVFVGKCGVLMLRLEVRSVADYDVLLMTDDYAVAWIYPLVS